MGFKPRTYQNEISDAAYKKLNTLNIVYLSMQVRTGKTITAFLAAEKAKCNHLVFITKKKAIQSIKNDYSLMNPSYTIEIINYESIHKIDTSKADIIVIDEAHSMGAYPKPSKRTKNIKKIVGNKRLILLSGTPTPESYSQIYHQFWVSQYSPFVQNSFYKWAHEFVNIKKVYVAHGNQVNDYSDAKMALIKSYIGKYMVSFTQEEAGFSTKVDEEILFVPMKETTYQLVDILKQNFVFTGKKGGVILADTGVKLMQKIHQLFSGTVKLEDGSATTTDTSKAEFIKKHFNGKKIAIFYKFTQELKLLKEIFRETITTNLDDFNNTNKNIALQIVSGREGISLRNADCLVFYNIDFSATSYWQARDRLTTKERAHNKVYWIFSKGGIEENIYNTVLNKKNYTLKHFERENTSNKNYQKTGS